VELQKEEKYPKSASLHQSLFLISMTTEQQILSLWPECKIVHGKPRHPQSQGSLERANADIKDMTVTWMRENSCKDWLVGIKFVQFQKNLSYHSGIKRIPYKAMLGVEAKVGLTSTSLPDEIISKISTEDDLKDITHTGVRNDFDIIEITDGVSGTGNTESVACIVCQKPAPSAHSCSICSNFAACTSICFKFVFTTTTTF
jgi:hypothetical protein